MESEETQVMVVQQPEMIAPFGASSGSMLFRSDKEVDEFVAGIERRNTAIEKIIKAALKRLMPKDFVDMDGKPFLGGQGAERLVKYLGISVSNMERDPQHGYESYEEDEAGRLRVTYRAMFSIGGMSDMGVGTRDTHNPFLCKVSGNYKPLSEINLPHLDASARTACYRDGISRLLGFRGLTWEYLKELGFSSDMTDGVKHVTGTQGGNASGKNEAARNLQTEISNMIMEMAGGDKEQAGKTLENYTRNEEKGIRGYKDAARLSEKQVAWLHPRIKKDYDEFMRGRMETETGGQGDLGI